jgi:hypothetical protein
MAEPLRNVRDIVRAEPDAPRRWSAAPNRNGGPGNQIRANRRSEVAASAKIGPVSGCAPELTVTLTGRFGALKDAPNTYRTAMIAKTLDFNASQTAQMVRTICPVHNSSKLAVIIHL